MASFELTLPDWVSSLTSPWFLAMLVPAAMVALLVLGLISRWMLLASIGSIITAIRVCFAGYQMFRIVIDLALLSALKIVARIRALKTQWATTPTSGLRQQLLETQSYEEYMELAKQIDDKEGSTVWKFTDEGFFQQKILQQTTESLRNARQAGDFRQLKYLVAGLMKRNHLGIEDEHLYSKCLNGTKISIETFLAEVEESLHYLADLPEQAMGLQEKFQFFRKASKSIGLTALCLSGGGAIAMYHVGVITALIKTGLFKHIKVFSGTSGGSIIAAMCASRTEDEFLDQISVPTATTDFWKNGDMKKKNIRWFPPLWDQILRYIRTGYLVDNKAFQETCAYHFGDMTFAEAYEKTRRHVCIPITASRAGIASNAPQKLLLNHVSTPHILLRSAVAASCALPGIMGPNKLLAKNAKGEIVPFEGDGHEWIDGSIQADVPYRRMAALFSVSNFLVSQTNFHVLPFIGHQLRSDKSAASFAQQMMTAVDLDLRHRTQVLSQLGFMPKLYGQDISRIFNQKYHGNVTIVPDLILSETFGVNAILNPTIEDMTRYIRGGQLATWPHMERIHHMIAVESAVYECMEELLSRRASLRNAGALGPPRLLLRDTSETGSILGSTSVSDFVIYGSSSDNDEPDDGNGGGQGECLQREYSVESLDSDNNRTSGNTLTVRSTTTRKWRRRVDGTVHSLLYGSSAECQVIQQQRPAGGDEHQKLVENLQARILYLEGVAARAQELEAENNRLRALLGEAAAEADANSVPANLD